VSKLIFWSSKSNLQEWSVCDPAKKKFSHPSLVILLFSNPAHKTELGLQIGGRLLIANHLDQSLRLPNQKQGAAVRSHLLHSSLAGVRLYCAFHQPQQTVQNCWGQNYFAEPNWHALTFLHPMLICRGHILSTSGVALLNSFLL
jgi:hypothetical protein